MKQNIYSIAIYTAKSALETEMKNEIIARDQAPTNNIHRKG